MHDLNPESLLRAEPRMRAERAASAAASRAASRQLQARLRRVLRIAALRVARWAHAPSREMHRAA